MKVNKKKTKKSAYTCETIDNELLKYETMNLLSLIGDLRRIAENISLLLSFTHIYIARRKTFKNFNNSD